ncbi:MAG: hypothetical protein KJ065_03860 [Anaerolineae bacterium]|nr:hypothetical protein [Anaerolineae bacterium]
MLRLIWFVMGFMIGMWLGRPLKVTSKGPTAPAVPTTSISDTPAPFQAPPSMGEPDDLTTIKGIGPAFVERLNAMGIATFAALAAQDPETLSLRLGGRPAAERIRRERWIEQAQEKVSDKR